MKNIAIIIASIFLLSTAALAGEGKANKGSKNTQIQLTEKISNMLGYPSYILNESSEAVMISYSVDENNIIHVQEILTSNIALKQHILKHMDGKKMKKMHMEGKNGVVKVHFNSIKGEKLHFQY